MRATWAWLPVLVCAAFGACSMSERDAASAEPHRPDACEALRGARFRSRLEFPAGLGPEGVEVGHQHLSFSADGRSYEWAREDMTSSGQCTCSDGALSASAPPASDGKPLAGRFDLASGTLTWNGIELVREP